MICGSMCPHNQMFGYSWSKMNIKYQELINKTVKEVATEIFIEYGGIENIKEDESFRPLIVNALQEKGFNCSELRKLNTTARTHEFDIIWELDGEKGAIELKIPSKSRNHPVDDSRLFFWYDIKWLEVGIEASSFNQGTAILLTDLIQLYEETGRGDWRHDYYRIGHLNEHRCNQSEPDHYFEKKYKPENQFIKELYPLSIKGCYDFRDKWSVIPPFSSGEGCLYYLVVPVL